MTWHPAFRNSQNMNRACSSKKYWDSGIGMDTWQVFARLQICPGYPLFQGLASIRGEIVQVWIHSLRIYTPFCHSFLLQMSLLNLAWSLQVPLPSHKPLRSSCSHRLSWEVFFFFAEVFCRGLYLHWGGGRNMCFVEKSRMGTGNS